MKILDVVGGTGGDSKDVLKAALAVIMLKSGEYIESIDKIDGVKDMLKNQFNIDVEGLKDIYEMIKNKASDEAFIPDVAALIAVVTARYKNDPRYAQAVDAYNHYLDIIGNIAKDYNEEVRATLVVIDNQLQTIDNFLDNRTGSDISGRTVVTEVIEEDEDNSGLTV